MYVVRVMMLALRDKFNKRGFDGPCLLAPWVSAFDMFSIPERRLFRYYNDWYSVVFDDFVDRDDCRPRGLKVE